MRQIADVDGIEQPDGSFLHRRTHTPDPLQPFDPALPRRQLSRYSGHSLEQVGQRVIGHT